MSWLMVPKDLLCVNKTIDWLIAYTSNFVRYTSSFLMNINDEKSWPDLMTKQNWYTKTFPQEYDYELLNPK